MVNSIRTLYRRGLNKRFDWNVRVYSQVLQEIPEEGRRTHRPTRSKYNNKDEDKSSNTLNNKKEMDKVVNILNDYL